MSPAFAYRAIESSGRRVHGRAEAADATVLARTLRERGLILLDADASRPARWRSGLRFRPGHKREVLEVTRALASLLPAGLPLAGAMRAAGHMATGEVAEVVEDLRERVQRGESLVDALSEHPDLFPPLYVGVVRAGERSGDLAAAFARLARQLERQHELRSRLLSASIYPLILAALGGLAVVVLLVFVIPRFAELLQGAGASLPRSTAAVLAISSAIRASWPLLAAAAVLGLPLTAWWWSADAGRRLRTRALLSLPVLRGLQRHNLAARFARVTGTLLSGGAPLLSALDDAAESMSDPVARDETARIRARVREGMALQDALAEGALFPKLLAQLVGVGVESGQVPEFLHKAAEIFEENTDRAVQRAVALAEPAMIVVFGSIVAVVALALLQAIYSVNPGAF